jgi:hypothetical protein
MACLDAKQLLELAFMATAKWSCHGLVPVSFEQCLL